MDTQKVLKVVIAGDKCTGKSTLTSRLAGRDLDGEYSTTIGVDFMSRTVPEVGMKILMWDLGGEERFENIILPYFKSGNIVLLVYSVDRPESLCRLKDMYIRYKKKDILKDHDIIVVCNKLDTTNVYSDWFNTGISWANDIGAEFMLVSAKENVNVEGLLKMILYKGNVVVPVEKERKRSICLIL